MVAEQRNRGRGPRLVYVNRRPLVGMGGAGALADRTRVLREVARPDTQIEAVAVPYGPASIESVYEEYLSVEPTAQVLESLADTGIDGAVVGCFGDPGLDALRELFDFPIVGPGTASMAMASLLGHRFGVVTVTAGVVHALRRVAWDMGLGEGLVSVRHIDSTVADVGSDEDVQARIIGQCRAAIEQDGAEVLVLGCMTMGFSGVAEKLTGELGVPVVNPVRAAVSMCESVVTAGLSHSRLAYPVPARVASGARLSDLVVGP